MRDVSCKLLSTTYKKDKNGIQILDKIEEKEIPQNMLEQSNKRKRNTNHR